MKLISDNAILAILGIATLYVIYMSLSHFFNFKETLYIVSYELHIDETSKVVGHADITLIDTPTKNISSSLFREALENVLEERGHRLDTDYRVQINSISCMGSRYLVSKYK